MEITQHSLSVWNLHSVQMLRSNKKGQFTFTHRANSDCKRQAASWCKAQIHIIGNQIVSALGLRSWGKERL